MNSILLIDDDTELCELLGEYLPKEGFAVESINDPLAGIDRALSGRHDLVVLDVMMPRMGGFDVLRTIRRDSGVPVLMLTARGDDVDRIVGLEIGADDYLAKPFNARELVARIRAILRRTENRDARPQARPGGIEVGDVLLYPGMRTVTRRGRVVDLTSVEFSILEVLLAQAGKVVSRDELLRKALCREYSIYDRSVDVHISSLRKKLGADGAPEQIKTVRNVGYLYVLPAMEDCRGKGGY